jgi:hypothetical protein
MIGQLTVVGHAGSRDFSLIAVNSAGSVERDAHLEVVSPPAPQILSLALTPTITGPGGSALARFEVQDASWLELWVDGRLLERLPGSSDRALLTAAASDLWFELHAVSASSSSVAVATATLAVDPRRPAILAASADPDPFPAGQPVTLSWSVFGAQEVDLVSDTGVPIATSTRAQGSVVIIPEVSLGVIVTARNPVGASERDLFLEAH